MESSILSEVDDTSILRTGLPTPLCLSSQPATGLSPLVPRSGLERSDFVPWGIFAHTPCRQPPAAERRKRNFILWYRPSLGFLRRTSATSRAALGRSLASRRRLLCGASRAARGASEAKSRGRGAAPPLPAGSAPVRCRQSRWAGATCRFLAAGHCLFLVVGGSSRTKDASLQAVLRRATF